MGESVGIGVVGMGLHGARYARHLAAKDVPNAHLTAVWRRDAHAGAEQASALGARFEHELRSLAEAPDVEAVIVAVPVGLHAEVAAIVAKAGKALLIEKPIARTVAEAEQIRDAFESRNLTLGVAQTLRFDPLVVQLAERASTLGALTGFDFEQRIEPRGRGWEDVPELAGGGVVMQTGIHTLDALRVITRATALQIRSAIMERVTYRHVEDHALMHVSVRGSPLAGSVDPLGGVRTSKIGGSRHMRFELYFEEGGLEADFIGRTLTTVRHRDQQTEHVPERPTVVEVARRFVEAVHGRGPVPVTASDAIVTLQAVEDAYRSAGLRE